VARGKQMIPDHVSSYFKPVLANCYAVSKRGLGVGYAAFSPISFVAVLICAGPNLFLRSLNPAVIEIDKERGSAEVVN
jgi:hypothetical protein